ncbi:hypothetical protein HpDR98_03650 [Helicobacter pylori]
MQAWIAKLELSMPINFRCNKNADFKVVPEPQKQSKTILSLLEEVLMIKSNN